jgi:thioredoxin reductase (NADPH)
MSQKIAIIGSGPSGLTAGIYTSRASLDTTIYLGIQPGGQLTTTTEIENFPGFVDGIMGPELMDNMQRQAERFGAKTIFETVRNLTYDISGSKPVFTLLHDSGETSFDAVIIASGASARYLGLPNEEKYIGRGYHSCATCDGFFYKNKEIIVIGAGDSAMEEANFLTKFASTVYLVHRSETFRASKIMIDRAKANPKIKWILNKSIVSLNGESKVSNVELKDSITGEVSNMDIDGVFVAIGHTPNTEFVKGRLSMDEAGYLLPKNRTMSEIDGIFIAGDVEDTIYRQAITAAGDGCRAAMDCEKWLESIQ